MEHEKIIRSGKDDQNTDGERLQIIEVFESKPKDFSYIVFVEK